MTKAVINYGDSVFVNDHCVEGAKAHLQDGCVDLIVTDPPYGIGGDELHKHYNRDESFVLDGYVEIPAQQYAEFSRQWIYEAARVLRPGGSIYIISGYTGLYDVLTGLKATDLREINHIIWKYDFGVYTSRKFVSSHYHILYYEKPGGRRTFNLESRYGSGEISDRLGSANYRDREDVWNIGREYKPGKIKNKNELPAALLRKMIQYSSNEGDHVSDFFMGGCSTAVAAIGLGRKFTGFEISENVFSSRVPTISEVTSGELLGTLRIPKIGAENKRDFGPTLFQSPGYSTDEPARTIDQ